VEAAADTEPTAEQIRDRTESAHAIIKRYTLWAMGFGIIPVPILDIAAITGVQLKMMAALAEHYHQEFSHSWGKSILGSLVGGIGATGLAYGTFGALVKAIPGIGTLFGMVAVPVMAGATTYAVGKVFQMHFASGGTMLTFDVEKMRAYYEQHLRDGVRVAESARAHRSSSSGSETPAE
jgi:uncharacterized protein (DUF697 family)